MSGCVRLNVDFKRGVRVSVFNDVESVQVIRKTPFSGFKNNVSPIITIGNLSNRDLAHSFTPIRIRRFVISDLGRNQVGPLNHFFQFFPGDSVILQPFNTLARRPLRGFYGDSSVSYPSRHPFDLIHCVLVPELFGLRSPGRGPFFQRGRLFRLRDLGIVTLLEILEVNLCVDDPKLGAGRVFKRDHHVAILVGVLNRLVNRLQHGLFVGLERCQGVLSRDRLNGVFSGACELFNCPSVGT